MRVEVATPLLFAYYAVGLFVLPAALRRALPDEVVRKLQHVVYGVSVFALLELYPRPGGALLAVSLVVVVAYPFLVLLERSGWLQRLLVSRAGGGAELRRQLLLVQVTLALLLIVFWLLLGDPRRRWAAVALMAWTVGDAAAALAGRAWGRHLVRNAWVEPGKTWEGVAAMAVGSFVAMAATLGAYVGIGVSASLFLAALITPAVTVAEAVSRRGMDTLIVPLVAALVLLPLACSDGVFV